jgi:hypothetical protein
VYVRQWSTVLRVPTSAGSDVYFKASAPVQAFEVPLMAALGRWRPDAVVHLLAFDVDRACMLMSDGGTRLREVDREGRDINRWEAALRVYSSVQRDIASHADELLALGVPDLRLSALPAAYERLLDDTESLLLDGAGLTQEEHGQLRGLTPRFAELCAELAAYGIPETIQHDDLHDGNVFVRDDGYLIIDWGDSSVSHPFMTFRTTSHVVADVFDVELDDPLLVRLRDVYLEPWERYGGRLDLLAAFDLALQVGIVCRALTFQRFVTQMQPPIRERYADTVPTILRKFIDSGRSA